MKINIEKIELQDKSIIYAFEDDYITSKIKSNNDYYESTLLMKFKEYIPKEPVIYDIGANIGNHTVYFSKYANPKKIYSFEPVKEVYDLLIKNIQANNIHCAQAFNVAIGNKNSNISMEICQENLGGNKVVEDGSGDIKLILLDNAEIDPPGFIKIDVEGYEYNVLQGLKHTLIKHKPIIWIEIFKENFRDINKLLSELGYEIIERIESNCMYKFPVDEEERIKIQDDFKNNIVNYYEETINIARKKYMDLCGNVNITKEKLSLANEKYKQATVNYSKLQSKISVKDVEISKLYEKLKSEHESSVQIDEALKTITERLEKTNNKYIDEQKESKLLCEKIEDAKNKNELLNNKIQQLNCDMKELKTIVLDKEQSIEAFEQNNIEKEKNIDDLNNKNNMQEEIIERLQQEKKDILQNRSVEIELLSKKALIYLEYIEKSMNENEELNKKRKYLIERTEILYNNNNKLVDELKILKQKYKALRSSKLGKITVLFWKLKRRLR